MTERNFIGERTKRALGIVLIGLSLAACQKHDQPAATAPATTAPDGAAAVNALADELLARLQKTNSLVQLQRGVQVDAFDAITFEFAQEEAKFYQQQLARLDAIALDALPPEQWLLAQMLRHTFASRSHAEESYWLEFAVTPYAGGSRISLAHQILASQKLQSAADLDHYQQLLDAYASMLGQIAAKTRAQSERGIRVARPAIAGVLATFRGLQTSAPQIFTPSQERLAQAPADRVAEFKAAVQQKLDQRILPGYAAVIALFDDAYARAAPEQVGIGNLPGGKERYLSLITDYTGLALTPQQIRDLGEKRIAEIDERMRAVREQLGFKGSREDFHAKLRADRRFVAKSQQDMEQRYLSYVARMEPHIPEYFSRLPKAPHGVARLAAAAEKGMTYGYYQPPTPAEPVGHYYYNASDLDKRSLLSAAHLMYHELVPGHHLHIALQLENQDAHEVRKYLLYDAFNEGWAEYAASLGEEIGLYSDPYDLYGHLAMQSFLTSRLVVDTGMNYLGMTLQQARAYMKAHTFESDVQINSETLRYSTDIPAQALGYRLGYEKFWELRHRAEQKLAARFDIRKFHAAAIGEGAMPLDVLERHIDRYIAQSSQSH
jgi:uncharacterized protein (DUF885 family)